MGGGIGDAGGGQARLFQRRQQGADAAAGKARLAVHRVFQPVLFAGAVR